MNHELRLKRLVDRVTPILKETGLLYLNIIAKNNKLPDFSNNRKVQPDSEEVTKAIELINTINKSIDKLYSSNSVSPSNTILKIGEIYLYSPDRNNTVDFYLRFNNSMVKLIDITNGNNLTYYKNEAIKPEDKDKCIYYVEPVNDTAYKFYARSESLYSLKSDDLQVNQSYWYIPNKTNTKHTYWMYSGFKVKLLNIGGAGSSGYPGDALGPGSDCKYLIIMEEQGNWKFRTRKESLRKID